MIPYLVCQFSKSTVSNLVKECFGSDFPDIFKKPQITYLYHYLQDLGARSVLLEREYVDKDYLEDFSRYYVKCFNNGGYRCARLHFFSQELDHTQLEDVLKLGEKASAYNSFQGSYLGFIVIKPLPKTFIGKTCLKAYPELVPGSPNTKCLHRTYRINLFGIDLEVESLAFQEQDKVVSACATTAIWTALHACRWKNEKQIPACSQITTNAINFIDGSNNSFPNKELTNKQILRALDFEDFKYHNESIEETTGSQLFETIRCHIDSDIPVIIGGQIYTTEGHLGGHAVTILGYKEENDVFSCYAHDDRFGPFAKARIIEQDGCCQLTLQKKNDNGEWLAPHEFLRVSSLIIPTHKKVRIPYTFPQRTCNLIIKIYEKWLISKKNEDASGSFTFALQLYQISDIKKIILGATCDETYGDLQVFQKNRAHFLTKSYARFQWVATFHFQGEVAFRVLFDATDIPQGNAVSGVFIEKQNVSRILLDLLKKWVPADEVERQNESFINSVIKFLKAPIADDYYAYLDRTFGELRAPKYLYDNEVIDGAINFNESVQPYYERSDKSLDEIFADHPQEGHTIIWAISADGALLIGVEEKGKGQGHPTITGFKPARIAGELHRLVENSGWGINFKSGRYSSGYTDADFLLENALLRFKDVFPKSSSLLSTITNA